MKLKALRLLVLGSLHIGRGEVFDAAPAEGKELVKKGLAVEAPAGPESTPEAGPTENTSVTPQTAPTVQTEQKSDPVEDAPDGEQVRKVQLGTTLKDLGGGWYQLSNGKNVQGKEAAEQAEKALSEKQEGGEE